MHKSRGLEYWRDIALEKNKPGEIIVRKTVLVTGGSRGIGAETCKLLAKNNYDVVINYRSDLAAAEKVAQAVQESGGRALLAKCDVGSEAEVVKMFKLIDKEFGYLDGLVNNAGISGPMGRVDELEGNSIMEVLGINVMGPIICCREAILRMSTRHGGKGGAIVNLSSGSAYLGNPGKNVLYAVSKGGVNSLMSGLSQEVAGEGVRVNNIAPGLTRTEMVSSEVEEAQRELIPMRRLGETIEIAEAILWLLSDKASFVAGANIRIAGGRL
jgi:NAD(P)-dependent dehydrogenase (short-subunit alcohol dehydrogenase family)